MVGSSSFNMGNSKVMKPIICPYCHAVANLEDSSKVYGKSYGPLYICSNFPKCNSFVGVHKNSNKPLGSLANEELRFWRKKAHSTLDPFWQNKTIKRSEAYELVQTALGLPKEKAHIAMLDVDQCKRLIERLQV